MQVQVVFLSRFIILIYLVLSPFLLSAGVIRSFQYDKNNQLLREEKANGHWISYEYDPCGQLTKETASDGKSVEYAYDKNGNCSQMTDSHGTTHYAYDQFNQLVMVQFPNMIPVSYKYDVHGRMIMIVYPNGWRVEYGYDSCDRLRSVTDKTGLTKYDYDDATNTLTKIILSNGTMTEYQYDRAKRITDVIHKHSDGTDIRSYHYTFDANGNRTEIREIDSFGTKTTHCTYDKLNRLVSVENEGGYERFTYDGIGNRLTKETPEGVIHYEYDACNRLIKAGDTQFSYDASGNLIKKSSEKERSEYAYDAYDNLIEFRNDLYTVKYAYDGAGRRITKSVGGKITRYINDVRSPLAQVLLQKSESEETATYTYGLTRLVTVMPDGIGHYLYDYPDRNVVAVVDSNQEVVNKYQYASFGTPHPSFDKYPNDFLYAGEAYEKESQLIYLRNRYYDPALGRFISADPEFGSKTNPQSMNPYTYVNNNPINYIDPSGLRSAKACVYPPGTKTKKGRSFAGHGFWVLTYDDGSVDTIGRYRGEPRFDDEMYHGTISHEWPATDDQIKQIIKKVKEGEYSLFSHNCINGLEEGLDILGVKHPSLGHRGVSIPSKATLWLESVNRGIEFVDPYKEAEELLAACEHEDFLYTPRKPRLPPAVERTGDVGGVSLNKTAKLLGHISEVHGASYDDSSGQLIMVGKKRDISLPEMDFDDLAVAVKSIYGLGGKQRQNPGVSMDVDPHHPVDFDKIRKGKKPPPLVVRYDGQTKDTRFGWNMFEADRMLKCLTLGKDNYNGKEIKPKVDGYKTLTERYKKNEMDSTVHTRLWIVPKEVSISKNRKGTSIVFKKVEMEVLTETTYFDRKKKKALENSAAEKFAKHFTKNYDIFAKRYPIFKEVERLAKITAVVKWMRENKIPLDLSMFEKYTPEYKDTPKHTPAIYATFEKKKGNSIKISTIVGGVVYQLDDSNFHEVVNEEPDPVASAALQARPSDEAFAWTFISPVDSMEYQAVAQPVERTAKVGNVRKRYVDMYYKGWGEQSLELIRYYNSFNDNDIGLGRGWDFVCTRLRFPRTKVDVQWKDEPAPIALYPEIFVEEDGSELRYSLIGLGKQRTPLYRSEDAQAILSETDQGFTLAEIGGKQITFSREGKILNKTYYAREQVTYTYDQDQRLVEIVHPRGKKIQFVYDGNRITKAIGPGDKHILYGYDSQCQLSSVSDALGAIEKYGYDSDKNLNDIRNGRNEALFTAVYDDYHRATSQTLRGESRKQGYDLKSHTSTMQKSGQTSTACTYDSKYRLLQAQDSRDRMVKMTYEDGQSRPKSIADCLGNEKGYSYDARGNIIGIVDSLGRQQRFWYNQYNQLFAAQDAKGNAEYYTYNERGHRTHVYHAAKLTSENQENGTVNFSYNPDYATEYGYDPASGLLSWIKVGGTLTQSYVYNGEGQLIAMHDPAGYAIHKAYDARGQLLKVCDSEDAGLEYTYDERGRVRTMSTYEGTIVYEYDDIGNLSSVLDASGGITRYCYDSFGNLRTIEDPIGGRTTYEYDQSHKLKCIVLPNGSIRSIEYDAIDRPKAEVWQENVQGRY